MRTVAVHVPLVVAAIAALLTVVTQPATAQSATEPTAAELAEQIRAIKREYETRIDALEAQLSVLESKAQRADREGASPARPSGPALDNAFNPAIGIVLDGKVSRFSSDESNIPGFQTGHESERPASGLALGHSEITMSSNIDDKFFGNLTLGLGFTPASPPSSSSRKRTSRPCRAPVCPRACASRRAGPCGPSDT